MYHTWLYDSSDEDDKVPRNAELSEDYVYRIKASVGELQPFRHYKDMSQIVMIVKLQSSTTKLPNPHERILMKHSSTRLLDSAPWSSPFVPAWK